MSLSFLVIGAIIGWSLPAMIVSSWSERPLYGILWGLLCWMCAALLVVA